MPNADNYDPIKAREYYLRTRKLKGRTSKGSSVSSTSKSPSKSISSKPNNSQQQKATARVARLEVKVKTLEGALSKALAELSKKRIKAAETERKNSDGKTTAKERQSSKEYRDKHREEIKDKAAANRKTGGSSGSSSKGVSDMSVAELESRISKIRSALRDAKHQLSSANQKLGQLAHSVITSDPMFEANFARFQSAERIPSK